MLLETHHQGRDTDRSKKERNIREKEGEEKEREKRTRMTIVHRNQV